MVYITTSVNAINSPSSLNITTAGTQTYPELVQLHDGSFAAFYFSTPTNILARLITSTGDPTGNEITVATGIGSAFSSATVLANGNIVIAYIEGGNAKAQIYSPGLVKIGSTLTLFDDSSKNFTTIRVDATATGFAAVADRAFQVSSSPYDRDIHVATFSSTGVLEKSNSYIVTSDDRDPTIAVLANGNIAVAFNRYTSSSPNYTTFLAIYSTDSPNSALKEVRAPQPAATGPGLDVELAAMDDGNLLVAYKRSQSGGYTYPGYSVLSANGDLLRSGGQGTSSDTVDDVAVNSVGYGAAFVSAAGSDPRIDVLIPSSTSSTYLEISLFSLLSTPSYTESGGSIVWINNYTVEVSWTTAQGGYGSDGNGTGVISAQYQLIREVAGDDGSNDSLDGTYLLEKMTGGGGNDTLNGGGGPDTMQGGAGNDLYYVDDSGDVVDEPTASADGYDTVYSYINYTLPDNIEALVLIGGGLSATGNALANYLQGNSGNNWLDGSFGADLMKGLGGNDSYVVDNAGDVVNEIDPGSGGWDTVYSSIDYRLGTNLEALILLGTSKLDGTGNGQANFIQGNSNANVLKGSSGDDTVKGMGGKDVMDGGSGKDTADYSDKTKSVIVKLDGSDKVTVKVGGKSEDTIKNFENVTGGTKGDNLTGDSKANRLDGGLGVDTLKGAGGNDKFVFSTTLASNNADKISDFSHKHDKIAIEDYLVSSFLGGAVEKAEFYAKSGAHNAHDADDRIIYNKSNGYLYIDTDGQGGAAAVHFATITNHPGSFDYHDIQIV